jgi:hypothetical protein
MWLFEAGEFSPPHFNLEADLPANIPYGMSESTHQVPGRADPFDELNNFNGRDDSASMRLLSDEAPAKSPGWTNGEFIDSNGNGQLDEDETIVVTGQRSHQSNEIRWDDGGTAGGDMLGGGDGVYVAPASDADQIEIQINVHDLTLAQRQALTEFIAAIDRADHAINALADNAKLVLTIDGVTKEVTGAELKGLWANTDFVINPEGHIYANETDRGEANWNFGNAIIGQNIDNIVNYWGSQGENAMNFLVLHELSHLTAANTWANANSTSLNTEIMANDIARAIGASDGLSTGDPTYGYSTGSPMTFAEAPPEEGGGSGPGSGGGGGGGGGGDGGGGVIYWRSAQ